MTLRTLRKHLKDFPPDTEILIYAGPDCDRLLFTKNFSIAIRYENSKVQAILFEPEAEGS